MRSTPLLLALLLAPGCRSEYVGLSRQLAVSAEAAEGQPLIERQRSYYHDDRSRPRLETSIKLYPDGTRVKHGPEREWYDGGQLRWEREFKDGEPFGLWISWHANGEQASRATFGSDLLAEMVWWYDTGQLSTEGQALNGAREGRWSSWHANGEKRSEGEYRANLREGVWTFWNDDGTLAERGLFRADERVGQWERGD